MKRSLNIFFLVILMTLSGAKENKSSAQVSFSVTFQTFYDELSPYGEWIYYPRYGYVWSPDDRYSYFHPYRSAGHWAWSTGYGWIWVSDYSWGWAPFHYGRWFYDSFYGWLWVPDYEWAPAWVVWRSGGDYYGWAPMSPGINISLYFGSYSPPYSYWCFAPRRYITSTQISNYYVHVERNQTIINNTTIINSFGQNKSTYVNGPDHREVERYTGNRIQPVSIRESGKPGRATIRQNELSLYRPEIQRRPGKKEAPSDFETYNTKDDRKSIENRSIINDNQARRERTNAEHNIYSRENAGNNRNNRYDIRNKEIKERNIDYERSRKQNQPVFNDNKQNPVRGNNQGKEFKRLPQRQQSPVIRNENQNRNPRTNNNRDNRHHEVIKTREGPGQQNSRESYSNSKKKGKDGKGE